LGSVLFLVGGIGWLRIVGGWCREVGEVDVGRGDGGGERGVSLRELTCDEGNAASWLVLWERVYAWHSAAR